LQRFSAFRECTIPRVTVRAGALAINMHRDQLMYKAGPHTAVRRGMLTLSLMALSAIASISAFAANSVTLAWDPSISTNVAGYRVYYGVGSRSYTNSVNVGAATSTTLTTLADGTTYYFAATAYDIYGLESDYSSETNYTTPVP